MSGGLRAKRLTRVAYRVSHIVLTGVVLAGCAVATPGPTASPSPMPSATAMPYLTPIPPSPEPTLPPEFQALKGTASGWEVDTIKPDGTGLQRISPQGVAARYPKFSPDGHWIAFERVDGASALMLYDRRSGETQVVRLPANSYSAPVWSPDSSRLLLTPGADFVVYDLKTGKLSAPIRWDDIQIISSASWSSDGRQVAFSGSTTPRSTNSRDTWEIYTVQTNGSGRRQLTHSDGKAAFAAWSPADDTLAYVEGNEVKLTWPNDPNRSPRVLGEVGIGLDNLFWSRNGLFVAAADFLQTQIFDTKTGTIQTAGVLTMGGEIATSWSPDMSKMLYEVSCCGVYRISYTDISAGNEHHVIDYRVLGDNLFNQLDPQWAPDADLIAFSGIWRPLGP